MGFKCSWIAVQGLTRAQVLEALGMTIADIQTDILEGVALFDWSDDWVVVLSDDDEDASGGDLANLASLGRAAVAYSVNQDSVYSSASGHEGGEDWIVTVKPEQLVFRVVGQPPAQLDSIIAAAKADQDDSDEDLFFAIPATLAESICGFRLGKGDPEALRHVSLKRIDIPKRKADTRQAGARPGFFTRLFGRG